MNHFCTISTFSHLYKVYALAESLKGLRQEFLLHVLIIDEAADISFENCRFLKISQLELEEGPVPAVSKYRRDKDKLRWALKPVLMKHLLGKSDIEKIIYLDNDLFFYSEYQFLFDLLEAHSFILTPHYYKNDPEKDQNMLEANFRVGMFNAGFVGANRNGRDTLQWWADCCEYRCEKNNFRGLFDDQKYLDLIPVMEESAHIVRHRGCNIAGWNIELCKREMVNGEIKIDNEFPVVFVHFNAYTIRKILQGEDVLLAPLYEQYEAVLKKYNPRLKRNELFRPVPITDKLKYSLWKFANALSN